MNKIEKYRLEGLTMLESEFSVLKDGGICCVTYIDQAHADWFGATQKELSEFIELPFKRFEDTELSVLIYEFDDRRKIAVEMKSKSYFNCNKIVNEMKKESFVSSCYYATVAIKSGDFDYLEFRKYLRPYLEDCYKSEEYIERI